MCRLYISNSVGLNDASRHVLCGIGYTG